MKREVEWTLADFDRLGAKVPHLADLKPGGRYVMNDLHRGGGTPAVLKALLDAGLLHGDCMTVTGQTLAENLKNITSIYNRKQSVIKPLDAPMHPTGHHRDPARQSRARRGVAKVAGLKNAQHHRSGESLRQRRSMLRRDPETQDRGRRCGRHPR